MTLNLEEMFPFKLDDFQLEAIDGVSKGHSVIVCAPTGSGKTVIAEYAVKRALAGNKRCFYTTPLKALSNQKFGDLRRVYGEDNVGLLTGDTTVNRNAPIVVMTTEVYRNMLYGTILGDVRSNLTHVESVIIDECHYMNDPDRGTVWEELVIYSPADVQLVALSATVANAEDMCEWFRKVHGPTDLILSDYRPVPLQHHYYFDGSIHALLTGNGRLNPKLKKMVHTAEDKARERSGHSNNKGPAVNNKQDFPEKVVAALDSRNMLPAIYFLFSRHKCDEAAKRSDKAVSLTAEARQALNQAIDNALAEHPSLEENPGLQHLRNGVASHHAGLLPLWKVLVENLFQQGLIKVVYATETLAAGINMPARSTVISAVSKYSDEGLRRMTASEFLQMSGRAGRRGMDEVGHVVVVNHPRESVEDAAELAKAPADPLVSRFTPCYGMVLNLLQTHTPEEARDLIARSFGQFVAEKDKDHIGGEISGVREQMALLEPPICGKRLADVAQMLPKSVKKKILAEEPDGEWDEGADGEENDELRPECADAEEAEVCEDGEPAILACTSDCAEEAEGALPAEAEAPCPAVQGNLKEWRKARDKAQNLGRQVNAMSRNLRRRNADEGALAALELLKRKRDEAREKAETMPCARCHVREACANRTRELERLRKHLAELEKREKLCGTSYWNQFCCIEKVLEVGGYIVEHKPTWEGELASSLRAVNTLFLSEVALSGVLEKLEPAELAGIMSAMVLGDSHSSPEINMRPSRLAEGVIEDICLIAAEVEALQDKYNVATPVMVNSTFSGLTEFWCRGADWEHVRNYLGWEEGDLIRTMRRTLDLLRQFSHAPHMPPKLVSLCQQAETMLDRDEVHEAVLWAD